MEAVLVSLASAGAALVAAACSAVAVPLPALVAVVVACSVGVPHPEVPRAEPRRVGGAAPDVVVDPCGVVALIPRLEEAFRRTGGAARLALPQTRKGPVVSGVQVRVHGTGLTTRPAAGCRPGGRPPAARRDSATGAGPHGLRQPVAVGSCPVWLGL